MCSVSRLPLRFREGSRRPDVSPTPGLFCFPKDYSLRICEGLRP